MTAETVNNLPPLGENRCSPSRRSGILPTDQSTESGTDSGSYSGRGRMVSDSGRGGMVSDSDTIPDEDEEDEEEGDDVRTLDNIELVETLAYMDIPLTEPIQEQREKRSDIPGHTDKINALAVSKDECFLLSGSKDKTVVLWDLKESGSGLGGRIKRFEEHSRPVLGVVYQEYEYKVLSMDTNQIVVVFVVRLFGGAIPHLIRQCAQIGSAAPDSGPIAAAVDNMLLYPPPPPLTGSGDNFLRIFDTRVKDAAVMEWKLTALAQPHPIRTMSCDPGGMWIATGFSSGNNSGDQRHYGSYGRQFYWGSKALV
eukprot:sb/3467100/